MSARYTIICGADRVTSDTSVDSMKDSSDSFSRTLRDGNIFLVGDAVHQLPANDEMNEDISVEDVRNLAWKLVLVLKKQAGGDLLETYNEERYPIVRLITENDIARTVVPPRDPGDLEKQFGDLEMTNGLSKTAFRYPHSRTIPSHDDGAQLTEDPALAIARPGSFAFDVLVASFDDTNVKVPISTFLKHKFVLFTGPDGDDWISALKRVQEQNPDLPVIDRIKLRYNGSSEFSRRYKVDEGGMVLVRPDGYVAEVVSTLPWVPFLQSVMTSMLKRVLCLEDLKLEGSGLPPAIGARLF